MSKDMNIQYINLHGDLPCSYFKVNSLGKPESISDFDINVIDLSDRDLWVFNGYNTNNLNRLSDILVLGQMIHSSNSRVLIILPQNLTFKYDNWGGKFHNGRELKVNTRLINLVLEKLLNLNTSLDIIEYNKTKTTIQNKELVSDFVFKGGFEGSSSIFADNGELQTAFLYGERVLITTLSLDVLGVNLLLSKIGWSKANTEVPIWFKNQTVLDDIELQDKQLDIENNIKLLIAEKEQIVTKIESNNHYKSILYQTGDDLVSVVNQMLNEMLNYDFENFKDIKKEDFRIEGDDYVFIGEIKGINTNVKRKNISQVVDHKEFYIDEYGADHKNVYALAIINNLRDIDPAQREMVSSDVVKVAERYGVLIITSVVFLKLFETFKKGEISQSQIVNLLSSKVGLLSMEDLFKAVSNK